MIYRIFYKCILFSVIIVTSCHHKIIKIREIEKYIAQVSVGMWHTLALRNDGALWAWGYNGDSGLMYYETGTESAEFSKRDIVTPVMINNSMKWEHLFVSDTIIIGSNNNSYIGWGYGKFGLFREDNEGYTFPHGIEIGTWKTISFSAIHAAAIKHDGTLWSWGVNMRQKPSSGGGIQFSNVPYKISEDMDWKKVLAGSLPAEFAIFAIGGDSYGDLPYYTIALKQDGTLWLFGLSCYEFTQIGKDSKWITIWAGPHSIFALKEDGTLWGIGKNITGALGTGDAPGLTKILALVIMSGILSN